MKLIRDVMISWFVVGFVMTNNVNSFQFRSKGFNRYVKRKFEMKIGGHNENFRFLPILRGGDEMHYPRIVPIAGKYGSLTVDQLFKPYSNPRTKTGHWTYDFTDGEDSALGTVAIPGSIGVTEAIDPVCVIATNRQLNVKIEEEVEMLVVIDRQDRDFYPEEFFMWRDPSGNLKIQWSTDPIPGWDIMGAVIICCAPYTESMKPQSTGWAEEGSDF